MSKANRSPREQGICFWTKLIKIPQGARDQRGGQAAAARAPRRSPEMSAGQAVVSRVADGSPKASAWHPGAPRAPNKFS